MIQKRHLTFAALMPATPVFAGMTAPVLTDVVKSRLDSISFFLFVYLICALLFRSLWNWLAKDFTWMPRLTLGKSVALLVVAGLFMYFILTMISGARELMTPGAWARDGIGYRLNSSPSNDPKPWLDSARQRALERMRDALRDYATKHEGKLPPHLFAPGFDTDAAKGIDPGGTWLGYIPGHTLTAPAKVLAYEPSLFGAKRWTLLTDSSIVLLDSAELDERIKKEYLP